MMNIFKMLNFYNFYKYVIKDIEDQRSILVKVNSNKEIYYKETDSKKCTHFPLKKNVLISNNLNKFFNKCIEDVCVYKVFVLYT